MDIGMSASDAKRSFIQRYNGKAAIHTIAQVCLVAVDVSNTPNDTQQIGHTDFGPG